MAGVLNVEMYRTILEELPSAVYLVDRDRRILLWNRAAEELTGYLRHEVIGRSCREDFLLHCDETRACVCGIACPLQLTMDDGRPCSTDFFLLHKDGQRVPVSIRAAPLRNEHGTIIGAIECFDKRWIFPAADSSLRRLIDSASKDLLTGLPDDSAMPLLLDAYLERHRLAQDSLGVALIMVNTLESLSREEGAMAADRSFYAAAQTMKNLMGPNDMIGRWQRDRFLAAVTGFTPSILFQLPARMKRLVNLDGVRWWGGRLQVTLSIGAVLAQAGDTRQALLSRVEEELEKDQRQNANNT